MSDLLIEERGWRRAIRWIFLDSLFEKVGYSLVNSEKKRWIWGRSILLSSHQSRRRIFFIEGFRKGFEFAFFRGIHLFITFLLIYQLYNYIVSVDEECQKTDKSLRGLINFYRSSDENVFLVIFHELFGKGSAGVARYFLLLFLLPPLWGLIKGIKSFFKKLNPEQSLVKIQKVEPGFWNDYLRWFIPLHPIDGEIDSLLKDLLWNADLSPNFIDELYQSLLQFVERGGYTSIIGLSALSQLVYAFSSADFPNEEIELIELAGSAKDARLEYKKEAFLLLRKVAGEYTQLKGNRKEKLRFLIQMSYRIIYAQYLLWSLGFPRRWYEAIFPTLFKLAKLVTQALFVKTVIEAMEEAKSCPEQPGVSLAGVQPWANDLTSQCFQAFTQSFNIIPGQPASTLVSNLKQYHFPGCQLSLNLSQKGINSTFLVDIVSAFPLNQLKVTGLNISGNNFNDPGSILRLMKLLPSVITLDLSSTQLGTEATFALGTSISQLTSLTVLNLSNNALEGTGVNGTQALGLGLRYLTQLKSLDLSWNSLGETSSNGTFSLAQNLPTSLTFLNLSNNYLGLTNSNATVALGKRLSNLRALTHLDLSNNQLESIDTNGTFAIGQGLSWLGNLRYLDLNNNQYRLLPQPCNCVGYLGNNGILSISEGLGSATSLEYLDLSYNAIGAFSAQPVQNLVKSLLKMPRLRTFNISFNLLESVSNLGVVDLGKALPSLSLQTLVINTCAIERYNTDDTVALAQGVSGSSTLTYLSLNRNYLGLESSTGVQSFNFLGSSLTYLDLGSNFIGTTDTKGVFALANGLSQLPKLNYLNLNQNGLSSIATNGTSYLIQKLTRASQLQYLDLGQNSIGTIDSNDILVLGQNLPSLSLTFLGLEGNSIGSNLDPQAFNALVAGISNSNLSSFNFGSQLNTLSVIQTVLFNNALEKKKFPLIPYINLGALNIGDFCSNLELTTNYLDFSNSVFNFTDNSFFPKMADCLNRLPLTGLNLSNVFDSGGSQLLNYLTGLSQLQLLSFSNNQGDSFPEVSDLVNLSLFLDKASILQTLNLNSVLLQLPNFADLMASLSRVKNLTSLDMVLTLFTPTVDNIFSISETIGSLPRLRYLSLSNLQIEQNANTTIYFASNLGKLRELSYLNLAVNQLGQSSSEGVVALGQAFGQMKSLREVDLNGNSIGSIDYRGTVSLAQGLAQNPYLSFLDLSTEPILNNNPIGSNGTQGVIALSRMIETASSLQTLNLNLKSFGSQGTEGPTAFVNSVLKNPNLKNQVANGNFSFTGLTNVGWSQIQDQLNSAISAEMGKACQANRCFGEKISASNGRKLFSFEERPQSWTEWLSERTDFLVEKMVFKLSKLVKECPSYFSSSNQYGSFKISLQSYQNKDLNLGLENKIFQQLN